MEALDAPPVDGSGGAQPRPSRRKMPVKLRAGSESPGARCASWLHGAVPHAPGCAAGCTAAHDFAALPAAYVYLLGLYLGDGSIATHPRGVFRLRFSLDTRYPGIIENCVTGSWSWRRRTRVGQVSHGTWVEVNCYSKSW